MRLWSVGGDRDNQGNVRREVDERSARTARGRCNGAEFRSCRRTACLACVSIADRKGHSPAAWRHPLSNRSRCSGRTMPGLHHGIIDLWRRRPRQRRAQQVGLLLIVASRQTRSSWRITASQQCRNVAPCTICRWRVCRQPAGGYPSPARPLFHQVFSPPAPGKFSRAVAPSSHCSRAAAVS